jgi:hypothetical protein
MALATGFLGSIFPGEYRRLAPCRSQENKMSIESLPPFEPWSIPAVRLLQGVVYSDDPRCWDTLLASQSMMETWFARIGMVLVIDEPEGLAFLRPLAEEEQTGGYSKLPRLFRRTRLSYEATLLCVLLREELRRFEEEDIENERCVIESNTLLELWKTFFPAGQDEVRTRRELLAALRKLEDLKFVRRFGEGSKVWEIRRILKARLPVSELNNLKRQLRAAVNGKSLTESTKGTR